MHGLGCEPRGCVSLAKIRKRNNARRNMPAEKTEQDVERRIAHAGTPTAPIQTLCARARGSRATRRTRPSGFPAALATGATKAPTEFICHSSPCRRRLVLPAFVRSAQCSGRPTFIRGPIRSRRELVHPLPRSFSASAISSTSDKICHPKANMLHFPPSSS